jgi:hypothetical protein
MTCVCGLYRVQSFVPVTANVKSAVRRSEYSPRGSTLQPKRSTIDHLDLSDMEMSSVHNSSARRLCYRYPQSLRHTVIKAHRVCMSLVFSSARRRSNRGAKCLN